ncbi:ATP-binding cassette transporter [Russula earlei]|uniref:ATP-binding cassette transporter n=1 Tax=Russula earlei TaxID=71964 RepID=A0ACC0UG47_9AGAM|nr:ATP-binding cassette transporter [Russula earlei]
MPLFQLPVAITLACSAFLSLALREFSASKRGKIALPFTSDSSLESRHDPFDVTSPEDIVDGEPIDEHSFWVKTKLRGTLLVIVFAVTVSLDAIALGFAVSRPSWTVTATYLLHVLFAVYLLVLAIHSVGKNTIYSHTENFIHLSVLTTLAFALLTFTALFPRDRSSALAEDSLPHFLQVVWYVVLGLFTLSATVAVTTPLGPPLNFPVSRIYSEKVVAAITNKDVDNVSGVTGASVWDTLLFSYTTKVVLLGNTAESLDIGDLPIVPGSMRATYLFRSMRSALSTIRLNRSMFWDIRRGSGWELAYRLAYVNRAGFMAQISLASVGAALYYAPPFLLQKLVEYLETDPERHDRSWGWFYSFGMFVTTAILHLINAQMWSLSTTTLQVSMRVQLNSILFAKTLVRKDVASSSSPSENKSKDKNDTDTASEGSESDEGDFSSKAQIMTLMTTDVDRVSEFSWHMFTLVDSPIEVLIGTIFLYNLLGSSAFVGLAVTCLFLPLNHFAGKIVVGAQENLMKARDERVALMNEILGAIRMLKFMAWERNFEKRVLKIREKELKFQKLNYLIEVLWNGIWNASPMIVTLVAFFHFAVIRNQSLTPSVAFTSVFFSEMKFALNALPETLINMLQSFVSLRRIEKYLHSAEVAPVPPLGENPPPIALHGATVTWPQDRTRSGTASTSAVSSASATPKTKFMLTDLNIVFPKGELSLICGKLGSGKTLLLLALLGEADFLTGQVLCPKTPPDAITSFAGVVPSPDEWVIDGVCAYVPQSAWLRNASIKENILFNLPYVEERYQRTLEVCALVNDLKILEDGDESEIGERGVNLSGGQKARVSLARAVYSRASILLLDDVLSAVDAHTAHILYFECLKGDLMRGRTVILVSHHVQLCAPGASYIVALENGRVLYKGDRHDFQSSGVMSSLAHSGAVESTGRGETEVAILEANEEALLVEPVNGPGPSSPNTEVQSEDGSMGVTSFDSDPAHTKKGPRKLVEEEARAVGRVGLPVWETYIKACGGVSYWPIFAVSFLLAAVSPVAENGWLSHWSGAALDQDREPRGPMYYLGIYAAVSSCLVFTTVRWYILYTGSIHASTVLYKGLLEAVLFANIRFHDTVSRGRLLNRFGKDFEVGIDSNLSDNFGRTIVGALSVITTFLSISVVGGPQFLLFIVIIGSLYWNGEKSATEHSKQIYGQTSRDLRRLDSVTRSPLYSIYGETISGVTILRAFGASSKFLRDMLKSVDTNTSPYYWMWGVNRWLSVRFNLLSAAIVGLAAFVTILTPTIDAALAGFILAFASAVSSDVRRFVSLEQSMVALERVKEYTELQKESPEFVEPRPAASWPNKGEIACENLVVRYAPDLPDVLHNLNFSVEPGEKIGILGRTGSGKSTLALSFFRFVEATAGRILIDGLDISKVGLTDLRSRLTIIPQDPTVLSGTLRSTLDVFEEYQDAEIYESLRRVHLIPSVEEETQEDDANVNVFRDLDSPVSEGGENFSTGEKQLLCMARAILKRSKVLVMDEAYISVDYATDELISQTIRREFAESTILTIAHRLRTVIDYNRIMLLEEGRIVEFDDPATLLSNPNTKFHALCKATGKSEFAVLKRMAGVQ